MPLLTLPVLHKFYRKNKRSVFLLRCSSQCRALFIVVPRAVNELPSQNWTKRGKIVWWCRTRLKTGHETFEIADFPEKVYLCALDQDCTSNFLVQCCLNRIWKALTRLRTVGKHFLHCAGNCFAYAGRPRQQCVVYFPAKHVCARQHCRLFSWAKVFMGLGKHCTGNFLVQCWHRQI